MALDIRRPGLDCPPSCRHKACPIWTIRNVPVADTNHHKPPPDRHREVCMGTPLDAAADGAEQWLANWSASASAQAAKAQQMSDQVSRTSVSAASQDGSVEVTVN